jgi:spore coat protein U domain-containing protein, fimbrial subunit CupE1/2/3/6
MQKRLFPAAAALVFVLFGPARTEAACTITTSGVAFGAYNVFSVSPVMSTGTIRYRCGPQERFATIVVTLSTGQSGTYVGRAMQSGTASLLYDLYLDAALTTVWGNGTGGTQVYSRVNPPVNQNVDLTVYGSIPAGQDVSAGTYSDTISATINF